MNNKKQKNVFIITMNNYTKAAVCDSVSEK